MPACRFSVCLFIHPSVGECVHPGVPFKIVRGHAPRPRHDQEEEGAGAWRQGVALPWSRDQLAGELAAAWGRRPLSSWRRRRQRITRTAARCSSPQGQDRRRSGSVPGRKLSSAESRSKIYRLSICCRTCHGRPIVAKWRRHACITYTDR